MSAQLLCAVAMSRQVCYHVHAVGFTSLLHWHDPMSPATDFDRQPPCSKQAVVRMDATPLHSI